MSVDFVHCLFGAHEKIRCRRGRGIRFFWFFKRKPTCSWLADSDTIFAAPGPCGVDSVQYLQHLQPVAWTLSTICQT